MRGQGAVKPQLSETLWKKYLEQDSLKAHLLSVIELLDHITTYSLTYCGRKNSSETVLIRTRLYSMTCGTGSLDALIIDRNFMKIPATKNLERCFSSHDFSEILMALITEALVHMAAVTFN